MAAPGSALEVLGVALRLGLTSFGGPIAHLGYQHHELVVRRRWLDERAFGDLVAVCQTLPGPGSSQLVTAAGATRAGWPGALAAWLGFTLPSAALMTAVGLGVAAGGLPGSGPWAGLVAGFQVAAVAVVAQAVLAMARRLTPDAPRLAMAGMAALVSLATPTPLTQLAVIAAGGLVGAASLRRLAGRDRGEEGGPDPRADAGAATIRSPVSRRAATLLVAALVALLAGLPVLAAATGSGAIAFADGLVRSGSLVFGGGHVVLPLLDAAVVGPGWVSQDAFLAGYGAAQAMPGPLFSFAAYLGAISTAGPGGVAGAALGVVAIFVPGTLLVLAALPALGWLRARPAARAALAGVNAAVVGILAAALVTPVAATAITGPLEAGLAVAGFLVLAGAGVSLPGGRRLGLAGGSRVPPLAVVALSALVMAAARAG